VANIFTKESINIYATENIHFWNIGGKRENNGERRFYQLSEKTGAFNGTFIEYSRIRLFAI
jgi:hypothetical protein